jgi:signal transduction histidine kinase
VSSRLDNLGKTRYRYLLEGNDEHWSDVTDQALADYRNLAPGRYTFRASSKGLHGPWGPPATFAFTVRPPWWRMWWAYLLYLVGLGALGWAYASYRSRRLRAENEALEAKVTERTTALHQSLEELRVAQTQLVQSEKMAALGELTAGIAHEIQNPLNFVNNFAEVSAELVDELAEEQARPERDTGLESELFGDLRQNLGKIAEHGKRAASIVRGMLEHSRQSTGERAPVDLNALCEEYLRLAYQGLRAKDKTFNATLNTDFLADLPPVTLIGADVGRVLLNLFTNAFYAVRQRQQQGEPGYQPQVGVRTVLLNQQVQILVTDNGTGMNPEVQRKIFQPFFTTKPTGEGTGLGLSLSHDIIAQGHGGSLTVDSQEGQGTTIHVGLPLSGPTQRGNA